MPLHSFAHTPSVLPSLRWDIFCQVIDNYGDLGVCWRLASQLGARGQQVRLWVDDARALSWMAPQGSPGVQVLPWPQQAPADGVGDVLIEAFGCEITPEFIAACAYQQRAGGQKTLWINLEYLSAESYVERCHRLPSPVMSGPGAGLTRWFFYPGFTPATGGLLREPDLLQRQQHFHTHQRAAWRVRHGVAPEALAISLFCYEPALLPAWLMQLAQRPAQGGTAAHLLVTAGRASAAVVAAAAPTQLAISQLAHCSQSAFDELLWACDLNCVRGEDSLVRALWAGQPLVWHIYPQHDDAHHAKLQAFLDWLQAPPSLRQFHWLWNGLPGSADSTPERSDFPVLDSATLHSWRECIQHARQRLLAQPDLLTQLLGFVGEKAKISGFSPDAAGTP
jgi:uncharacterized repeat protein (TIGR03837 family)